ncbi:ATP-grasp domain-containing protein [bacterium]|nr:ATP-grasp domain-containing protein [bacterium]MBU1958617.1 ATP-grasp domain-containing protein [bacterium]
MQKRILFLGGSKFQIPPIKYAKEQGHYVITCDYLPDNPGHIYADEYHNVSTTDIEAVLELSRELHIDGIVAYASDPAAPTQAYVANAMRLPSNPFESVMILSRKDYFRSFLEKHDFLVPKSESFDTFEESLSWFDKLEKPVIVKPVDSSGSKGVTKVYEEEELEAAFNYALEFSRAKRVVVEEFFERDGYQVAGDGFVVDGKLVFRCWANEHFDKNCNPFVPIGESFPSIMTEYTLQQAQKETQRLLDLLGMKHGALNFDFHYNKKGDFSFLELGPRNGGNLIPEVIKYATGVDLVKYTVDSALGLDCSDLKMKEVKGYYSSYMLHATEDGIVKEIWYSDEIKENIIEESIFIQPGDEVKKFDGSNHTLGTMIMKFNSQDEMLEKMDNMEKYLKVCIDN